MDDDKLPVLKNTYSKKNRPNNSKSVAIGSRSQGGQLKDRMLEPENEKSMSPQKKSNAKLKIEELVEQPDAIT